MAADAHDRRHGGLAHGAVAVLERVPCTLRTLAPVDGAAFSRRRGGRFGRSLPHGGPHHVWMGLRVLAAGAGHCLAHDGGDGLLCHSEEAHLDPQGMDGGSLHCHLRICYVPGTERLRPHLPAQTNQRAADNNWLGLLGPPAAGRRSHSATPTIAFAPDVQLNPPVNARTAKISPVLPVPSVVIFFCSHAAYEKPLRVSGNSRTRFPVAAKTALHSAGTNGGTPGSPTPAGGAVLSTICTSTCRGASFILATW